MKKQNKETITKALGSSRTFPVKKAGSPLDMLSLRNVHELCQNNETWNGYAVFTFNFNGTKIKFVTLADAKHIVEKMKEDFKN
jgi:hypothetical protein